MMDFSPKWLDECDSTSRVLKEQTKNSFRDVLVLASARQTAGTGRMGRSWSSLEGNLHFSIALPASFIREEIRDILPLAVGVLVSRWIEKSFAVRPCLKWPNDILIDGFKIGGTLCEGTFSGADFKGAVVGIGINLKDAPAVSEATEYPVGCLETLTGRGMPARLACDSLSRFFSDEWQILSRDRIFSDWRARSLSTGHLWTLTNRQTKTWLRLIGLDASGNLVLRSPSEDVMISSVHNNARWSVQMSRELMVADIGNSRTKLGVFCMNADGAAQVTSVASTDDEILALVKEKLSMSDAPVIHALSVNPEALKKLRQMMNPLGVDVREIQKTPVRLTRSRYDLTMIGADRFGMLEAMQYLHARGTLAWPAMVVSCGTATTIDYIDGSGQHLGGFILAGLQTGINALGNAGALLPKALQVKSDAATDTWPANSADAIIQASIGATLAFLKSERQRLAEHCRLKGLDVTIQLTGGYADLIKNLWTDDFIETNHALVLFGAGVLASNGR